MTSLDAPALPLQLPTLLTEESFDAFILQAVDLRGLADLSLQSDDYVFAKINDVHTCISNRKLEPAELEQIINLKYGGSGVAVLNSGLPLDFRFQVMRDIRNIVSFRANCTRARVGETGDGVATTLRFITDLPRPFESLGLEQELVDNLFPHYGLILVVGTTGSGKSTLLSSAMSHILKGAVPRKIGTFEDPIEQTYGKLGEGRMPKVRQVEIGDGRHLKSFELAGPNAMRCGFDVLILGEMRDKASVMAGMELASTGHAVYATMHVDTPAQVVDRLISFFPTGEQPSVASKLRAVLRLAVAQRQFPLLTGTSARVRSWLTFDKEAKTLMAEHPYSMWETRLSELTTKRGRDFESQMLPFLKDGRIDIKTFIARSGLTVKEARSFLASHDIDYDALRAAAPTGELT